MTKLLMDQAHTVVAGIDLKDPTLTATIHAALVEIEELLIQELSSGEDFLTETALHLTKAGGKRFRPLFTLLAAQFGPRSTDRAVIISAAVLELVHLATLYHDDVMDEATLRRGDDSANARWSNSVAILAGDYLFAHASRLVSTLGLEQVRILAETFAELVTGQMRETLGAGKKDPIEHYLTVVREKTGSLIAICGRFGAMGSGADPELVTRLWQLGEIIGTAFQISDDIIDISSPSTQSGKIPGTDLREGIHTLPVLYALAEQGSPAERLRVLLTKPITENEEITEALNLLQESTGLTKAKAKLREYAQLAHQELKELPSGPARTALAQLIDYTINRLG